MTNEATQNEDAVEHLVRLRIEVVGEDGDACRKLLRNLCDMIDADMAGAPNYSVSKIDGSASCDVDTLPNAPCQCASHAPDCAIAINTRHGCSCGANAKAEVSE